MQVVSQAITKNFTTFFASSTNLNSCTQCSSRSELPFPARQSMMRVEGYTEVDSGSVTPEVPSLSLRYGQTAEHGEKQERKCTMSLPGFCENIQQRVLLSTLPTSHTLTSFIIMIIIKAGCHSLIEYCFLLLAYGTRLPGIWQILAPVGARESMMSIHNSAFRQP